MQDKLMQKLGKIKLRFDEIGQLLAMPNITDDIKEYTALNREYSELQPIVNKFLNYLQADADLTTAKDMLQEGEFKEFALSEIEAAKTKINQLTRDLQILLLPKDENDDKNIYLEIRAGAGGDESSLFAALLFRMYARFAERNNYQVEIVSSSNSDLGGYKEIIAKISGCGAYSKLKFESGVHRVQRIPVTEAQGRIHTSTCTVAIMPEADEVGSININPSELKIDTFRASGAGGQHINKTDSAIRITHLPTGIVVECQDDRSQHRNKAQALSLLAAKIKTAKQQAIDQELSTTRKLLVGTGDRSERIRTYNFPQGRMTDHRINLTLYKLDMIMDGDLFDLADALVAYHQAELLAQDIE